MADSSATSRSKLFLILVIVALVIAWWWWKPKDDNGASSAQMAADYAAAARTGSLTGAIDPDDIVVDFRDDMSTTAIAALGTQLGLQFTLVSSESEDERFYRAHVNPNDRDRLLGVLNRNPDVEFAEPDGEVRLIPQTTLSRDAKLMEVTPPEGSWKGFPNDPMYNKQWHMQQIHMPAAWKLADGGGVIVAVLDTGVAFETYGRMYPAPDLDGITFVKPYNFVDNNKHAGDDHGHGTHVAGTIAQATHNGVGVAGVARNVKIMPLKVLSANGSGTVAGIADAIRYAADNGAKVINMSLGGPFPSKAMRRAVQYAHDKGVTVICAAGNEKRNRVSYPAAYPGSVSISATTKHEKPAFYTNYGKNLDLAGPGGDTTTAEGPDGGVLQNTIAIGDPSHDGYFAFMGTSMASPHVAGVAALIVGEGVTDPKQVERILKDTARSPKSGKLDAKYYGAGIVDAEAAVLAARSKTGGWQAMIALLLAGAVAFGAGRRGLFRPTTDASFWLTTVLSAGGLFFLPWISASLSSTFGLEVLTRGLPAWDLALLGVEGHGHALFFSALLPVGLVAIFSGVQRLRAPLAGVCVGVAGHLLFNAAVRLHDIQWIPNTMYLDQLWLVGNAAVCTAVAWVLVKR